MLGVHALTLDGVEEWLDDIHDVDGECPGCREETLVDLGLGLYCSYCGRELTIGDYMRLAEARALAEEEEYDEDDDEEEEYDEDDDEEEERC